MRKIVLLLVCVLLALPAVGQTTLNGAGATFPYPIYSKWFSEYHKTHPDVEINYQSIGSGGGIQPGHGRHGGFRRQRHADDRQAARRKSKARS